MRARASAREELQVPRKQADPDHEADAPLLPGWKYLEHVTPRRPARTIRKDGEAAKSRGRLTWGFRFQDPHRRPGHDPVTESTGKRTQAEALGVAKRRNGEIDQLIRDVEAKRVMPNYLKLAHVRTDASGKRKLIQQVIDDAVALLANDDSARILQDAGDDLVRYCAPLDVSYVDQLTGEILKGWLRAVILTPSKTNQSGQAKWFTSIDLWTRVLKTALRKGIKGMPQMPQLNGDIITEALPTFTAKKGGQASLVTVLVDPTTEQRDWITARNWGREPSGGAMDEGGKALSQATLHTTLHAALRRDCGKLRALIKKPGRTLDDIAACTLGSVDIATLLTDGFRRAEYAMLKVGAVLLDQPEPMDKRTRTHLVMIEGKGRHGSRERKVALSGYTDVGIELMREQIRGREADEYVAEHDYNGLDDLFAELLKVTWAKGYRDQRGRWHERVERGPRVLPKDLRSTGCNYGQRLHHIPERIQAERWGHTVQVHVMSYIALSGSALEPAKTLEEAMGCEPLMRRAIKLLQIRNALGIAARVEPRKSNRKIRKRTNTVKTPRVTSEARAPYPVPAGARPQPAKSERTRTARSPS